VNGVKVVMAGCCRNGFFSVFALRAALFVAVLFTITPITREPQRCEILSGSSALVPARKMRVEVFDTEGNRYTVAFQGQITREKAARLLDLVELLGGMSSEAERPGTSLGEAEGEVSKFDKVRAVIQKHLSLVWFSSRDLQTAYEQELKEPIALSTAATYLARMATRGDLLKAGASNHSFKYKTAPRLPKATLNQQPS
jgi:hypothetical protein